MKSTSKTLLAVSLGVLFVSTWSFSALAVRSSLPQCNEDAAQQIQSCIKSACQILGAPGCRFESDLQEITSACQNQLGASCLEFWCDKKNADCRYKSNLLDSLASCEQVGGDCARVACSYLPGGCRLPGDRDQVNNICKGLVDGDCIERQCGSYGENCGSFGGLQEAADKCKDEIPACGVRSLGNSSNR